MTATWEKKDTAAEPAEARVTESGPSQGGGSLLRLQRSAGNAAVVSVLARRPGSRLPVQRDDPPPGKAGTVTPTEGGGAPLTIPASLLGSDEDLVVSDTPAAATALLGVALNLEDTAGSLDSIGETSLRAMAQTTRDEAAKLTAPGPLSASDHAYLVSFLAIEAAGERDAVDQAIQRLLSLFQQAQPSPAEVQQIENLELDLAETLHQRFIAHENDQIKQLVELTEKVKGWNGKVGEYAGKVEAQTKKMQGAAAAASAGERAKQLKGLSKDVGEKLGSAKEILEVANDVATIAGAQGHPDGTAMMQGIDGFRAGIDLVDKTVGKLASSVPLFKDLWDKWYKPMVDACITGLTKLAHLLEIKDRGEAVGYWQIDQTNGTLERDANGAPVIDKLYLAKGDFPGGQAVFSYLYCLREGREPPAMSTDVKTYFLSRRDIMNEIASGKADELTSDWKLFSPSSWFTSGRETNLVTWLAGHWETVWSMLYGEFGAAVPH